ncbi:MAG: M81 family metallopeptidase [Proteobacteria bacterium]|nr:M81 family metallopeptidase [Pseudomonadota bacterium]MBI3495725.1 M81 family metallopeptidase [Pseudomonadota bacterium]
MSAAKPRIAILGFALESNRFAPVIGRAEFELNAFRGPEILGEAAKPNPRIAHNVTSFIETMNAGGPWTPVPILVTSGGAAGPADPRYFRDCLEEFRNGLKAAMPLDGVYCSQHGAATTTESDDPDGEILAATRAIVGADAPIIATLDLHANISDRMVASSDLLISYITNPHVDMRERGIEAAKAMRERLQGVRYYPSFIRLPLVSPSVALLTARGPYADLISYGQSRLGPDIVNVSILGGFVWGDTDHNGIAIIVTSRNDPAPGKRLAEDLARLGWADRARYVARLTPLEEAIRMMLANGSDPERPAEIFADCADNPGGGGRGNTTWILAGAHAAGAKGVAISPFFDPDLAAEAHRLGLGQRFRARFNRAETTEFSKPFEAEATVAHLSDGSFVGRRGTVAGRTVRLGPTATLDLGGIRVVVVSRRQQAFDTGYFENFGVKIDALRSVVVKSRGHFRAGFDHLFPPERTIEVDAPGLVSQVLTRFTWKRLKRPIYPLDPETTWPAPAA